MAPGLKNALVLPHRIDHRAALRDRQRHRFLAINILAGLARHHCHHAMPMIGHHDRHGVDILSRQHFAEIGVNVAAVELARWQVFRVMIVDKLPGRFAAEELLVVAIAEAGSIDIANGDDLRGLVVQQRLQDFEATIAGADDADRDPIARRLGAEHSRRHDIRRGDRGRRRLASGANRRRRLGAAFGDSVVDHPIAFGIAIHVNPSYDAGDRNIAAGERAARPLPPP